MATRVLPLDSADKDYEVTLTLDGVDYVLQVRWQSRLGAWFLNILDSNRTPLLRGQRIATDAPINRAILDQLPGKLFAISTDTQDDSDPGENDLGDRVLVVYVEAD